eukprot:scaffold76654_cov37-Phaeocystis_antarctica.AAC.2
MPATMAARGGAWPRRRLVSSGAGPCFAVHATCPVPPGEAAGGRRRECLPCTVLTAERELVRVYMYMCMPAKRKRCNGRLVRPN